MRTCHPALGRSGEPAPERLGALQVVECLLEPVGVRALGFGQRLEPIGNLTEALVAGGLRHTRVHVGVLVGLPGDGRLQVELRVANRQTRGRVADRLEILEVAVRVASLTFSRRTEHRRDVVEALDVRLGCEIQLPTIGLGFAGKGVLQVLLGLATFEIHAALRFRLVLTGVETLSGCPRGVNPH